MRIKILLISAVIFLFSVNANAQFKNYKIKGGAQYVQLLPLSEFDAAYSYVGRGYIAFELSSLLGIELGLGFGRYKTNDMLNEHSDSTSQGEHDEFVETNILPIDARLRISPWAKTAKNWNPYFYVGIGALKYSVGVLPNIDIPQYDVKSEGWTSIFPLGFGTEVKLGKNVLMDISGGVAYTFTDELNNFVDGSLEDSYANLSLGLTFAGNDNSNADDDKDGLTNSREEQIGTDPQNPDTDGDGLKDGLEVDSYKTNPLNKDTDGDLLTDGEEVLTYFTNPLNKDSDSDKLTDYDELKTYSTLPNDSDTDDDGLIDGDEVLTYKTNPKAIDTDVGSVGDGVEVGRGTNPLDPNDDVPVVKEAPMEVGTVIILEGINFASGSTGISSGTETVLEKTFISMRDNPEIVVEISGHTDSRAGHEYNMQLSKERAESVKAWLVAKGIDEARIQTVGYGPDQPIATNDTEEGMMKNRRIEFKRIK